MPGPLDGLGQFALVDGTVSGNTAGNNLSPFGNKVSERANLFVVYFDRFIAAKTAAFATAETAAGRSGWLSHTHIFNPSWIQSVSY